MDPQAIATLLIIAGALFYLYRTVRPRRATTGSDCAPGCASGCAGCSIAAEMRRDGHANQTSGAPSAPPAPRR